MEAKEALQAWTDRMIDDKAHKRLVKLIEDYARELCKQQRENCAKAWLFDQSNDPRSEKRTIRNAPEPDLTL